MVKVIAKGLRFYHIRAYKVTTPCDQMHDVARFSSVQLPCGGVFVAGVEIVESAPFVKKMFQTRVGTASSAHENAATRRGVYTMMEQTLNVTLRPPPSGVGYGELGRATRGDARREP